MWSVVQTCLTSEGVSTVSEQYTTVRRRKLGAELKRAREAAGVSLAKAAQVLDAAVSKISRMENGRSAMRKVDILLLLDCYGVQDEQVRTSLVLLARESRTKGWWNHYGDMLNPVLRDMISMEAECARINEFQTVLVPGLLQTEAYARAIIGPLEAVGQTLTPKQADSLVSIRMERQKVLQGDAAPQLMCVLDEAAITRPVGSPKVMHEQLMYLTEINRPPLVTIQILPFAAGRHAGMDGPFRILSYPDPVDLDVVCLGYLYGALYLEEDGQVDSYKMVFDHLRAQALSSAQSMDLLSRTMRDLNE